MKEIIAVFLSVMLLVGAVNIVVFANDEQLYCSNCGEELSPDSNFCSNCGAPVINESSEEEQHQNLGDNQTSEEQQYIEACQFMEEGEYFRALRILNKIPQYKDSSALIDECYYQQGIKYLIDHSYSNARIAFSKLKDYKNSRFLAEFASDGESYLRATESFLKGDYEKAFQTFQASNSFSNTSEFLLHFNLIHVLSGEYYRKYDNLNNLSSWQYLYRYDELGRVIETFSNNGQLPHFSRQIYSLAYAPYDFSWASIEKYTYNDDGTLMRIKGSYWGDQVYIVTFHYDDKGRVDSEKIITGEDEATAKYKYKNGRLVSVRFTREDNPFVEYSYNEDGSLKRIKTNVSGYIYDIRFRYNEDGTLKRKDVKLFGKDYMKERYEYNDDGTIKKVTYDYEKDTKGRVEISYVYKDLVFWDGADIQPIFPEFTAEEYMNLG